MNEAANRGANLVRINVLAFAAACGLDEEHLPNKVRVQKRGDYVLFTT